MKHRLWIGIALLMAAVLIFVYRDQLSAALLGQSATRGDSPEGRPERLMRLAIDVLNSLVALGGLIVSIIALKRKA